MALLSEAQREQSLLSQLRGFACHLVQAEYVGHEGRRTESYSHDNVALEKRVGQATKQLTLTVFLDFLVPAAVWCILRLGQ